VHPIEEVDASIRGAAIGRRMGRPCDRPGVTAGPALDRRRLFANVLGDWALDLVGDAGFEPATSTV
jgi:hypothetical protein